VAIVIPDGRRPNEDGWWDEGVHEVDGYWVTSEGECPESDVYCQPTIRSAEAILLSSDPTAIVTNAWMAGYPQCRGESPYRGCIVFAGLVNPRLVILDLENGSRRVVTLRCGAFEAGSGKFDCEPTELEIFKIGNRDFPTRWEPT
jgi:hypothetical protein